MELLRAEQIAWAAMQDHGLVAKGWTFDFDFSKRRFGCCNYAIKQIQLSAPMVLINGENEINDVVLHEIAHALLPIGYGHNGAWKSMCEKIGARPERCYDTHKDSVKIPAMKYIGVCPLGHEFHTMRKPSPHKRFSCNYCFKGFNDQFLITYKLNPDYGK